MKIGPVNRPVQTPELIKGRRIDRNQQQEKGQEDRVEISDTAREKLQRIADDYKMKIGNDNEVIEQISANAAKIRTKIEAGHYDLQKVQDVLVQRLTDNMYDEINKNKNME